MIGSSSCYGYSAISLMSNDIVPTGLLCEHFSAVLLQENNVFSFRQDGWEMESVDYSIL